MSLKNTLLSPLHKKQPWNADFVAAVTSPFGIDGAELKNAEKDLELRYNSNCLSFNNYFFLL